MDPKDSTRAILRCEGKVPVLSVIDVSDGITTGFWDLYNSCSQNACADMLRRLDVPGQRNALIQICRDYQADLINEAANQAVDDVYVPIVDSDALDFQVTLEYSFADHHAVHQPTLCGISAFGCVDKGGSMVNIPLISMECIDGKIQTKDFGIIVLRCRAGALKIRTRDFGEIVTGRDGRFTGTIQIRNSGSIVMNSDGTFDGGIRITPSEAIKINSDGTYSTVIRTGESEVVFIRDDGTLHTKIGVQDFRGTMIRRSVQTDNFYYMRESQAKKLKAFLGV